MSEVDNVAKCSVEPDSSTCREKWRRMVFPYVHTHTPEAPSYFKDVIVVRSITEFSFLDRLRILFSGRVETCTKTVTENVIGNNVTDAACYPLPPKWL